MARMQGLSGHQRCELWLTTVGRESAGACLKNNVLQGPNSHSRSLRMEWRVLCCARGQSRRVFVIPPLFPTSSAEMVLVGKLVINLYLLYYVLLLLMPKTKCAGIIFGLKTFYLLSKTRPCCTITICEIPL